MFLNLSLIQYRLDKYKLFNKTSSRIVWVAAARRLAKGFLIALTQKKE